MRIAPNLLGRDFTAEAPNKTELSDTFADLRHARAALAEYFDLYNYERRHSTLGNVSPALAELKPQPAAYAA